MKSLLFENVMIEGFKQPTTGELIERTYNSSECYIDQGEVVSLKNMINETDNPNQITEKVITFFDKVSQKNEETNHTRYKSAIDTFKTSKIRGVMRLLGGFFTQFFDGAKTSTDGLNNPSKQIQLDTFTKEESLKLYKELINKTQNYGNNLKNCMNAVVTASKALDDATTKDESYKSSMDYLVKSKKIKKGDAIIVNSPDADLQSALATTSIQGVSNSIYTHTMIITEVYDNGDFTCIDSTSERGGTKSIRRSEYCKKGSMDYMVLDTPDQHAQQVVNYCEENMGKQYDLPSAVIDGVTRKRGTEDSEFYCSELYINACEAAGMNIEKNIVAPGDIMKIIPPIYAQRQ